MRPGFHHTLLNSYFEDPCLYVRVPREKRALLFDAGDIHRLKHADLNKITDVFITHTHIDHFIGFDTLLRALLRREVPLNVYGPSNIIDCIEGKLKGYSWNVIHEYPFVLHVYGFNGTTIIHSVFQAQKRFKKLVLSRSQSEGLLLEDSLFHVRAEVFDHGIPCLAFSVEEEFHINIDKDRLQKRGLSVGPWLTDFKKVLREEHHHQKKMYVDGKIFSIRQLKDIAIITKGQKISFVTDVGMSKHNISRLIKFVKGSDILYCEAYFLEQDRDRALERHHLTARTCGFIARNAHVKKLALMHFSPKYSDDPESVINEAMNEFNR